MSSALLTRFPQISKLQKLGNLGFGGFSRIFSLGSQFVVLLLLGKLLEKSDFGDFMIVFALMRVLSLGLGSGLATLLVYHISRNASEEQEDRLHRSVGLLGLVLAGITALVLTLAAPWIAEAFDKPGLAFWIGWMAPFFLFSTMLTVSCGALDGRGRITRSIVFSEFLPNLIRLMLLPALLLLGYGNLAVVAVMLVSVVMPWLFMLPMFKRNLRAGFARLTGWDLSYSGKLTLHSFAAMQMQGIDMLVVGWLFSSTAAADYAIASRVAALVPFLQQIIVKGFMSKAGKAIHENAHDTLQTEIDKSRYTAALLVTATAVAAMIAYPILMLVMGDFGGSMPLFTLLAAGAIFRSYFPGADALIRVAGHANFSLGIMLTSAAMLLVMPFILSEWIGTYAVALSMLVSGMVLNPVMARFIHRNLHVTLIDRSSLIPMMIGLTGLAIAFAGGQMITSWVAGTLVLTASALPVFLVWRKREHAT
ncbi:lipopolysaccharide biosynthesis protein [Croceibacterium xixiisoli]|nr:oligosaccharide flippase family protein [Croceibacterium xixiisoli]